MKTVRQGDQETRGVSIPARVTQQMNHGAALYDEVVRMESGVAK